MFNVNPEQYLRENDLNESLVLRTAYLQGKTEFHLTIVFARTPELLRYLETGIRSAVAPPRDFRRLVFSGVFDISVSDVLVKRKLDLLDYASKDNPSLILQDVELQQNERPRISLYFGTYGTCSFNFDSLQVERKLGRAVKVGDDWDYYDVDSGKKFDFYNPF